VRIISATHRDLHEHVSEGSFREDLFYRLNVLPVHLPALRDRKEDLQQLISYFSERFCAREGLPPRQFDDAALAKLTSHAWPGNVRELENCISRAMLLAAGETITAEDITPLLHPRSSAPALGHDADEHVNLLHTNGARKTMAEIEQEIIDKTMQALDESVQKSAAALAIGQSTLYRKLQQQAS